MLGRQRVGSEGQAAERKEAGHAEEVKATSLWAAHR